MGRAVTRGNLFANTFFFYPVDFEDDIVGELAFVGLAWAL